MRFDKLLEDRVLKPFGMVGAGPCNERFTKKLITVRRKKDGSEQPANSEDYNWRSRGARGVLASVHDIHALLDRIHGQELVDARERDLLLRPLPGGSLKVITADIGGQQLRRIDGYASGYHTRWTIHESSRSWVVLCSHNKFPVSDLEAALVGELLKVSAEEPTPPPVEPDPEPEPAPAVTAAKNHKPAASNVAADLVDRFVGTFALPSGGCFRIEQNGALLRLHGEGLQASVRLIDGAWPGTRGALVQRSEDRGLALLARLIRGDATAVDEAFVDPGTANSMTTLLAGVLAEHGALQRIEFLGTDFTVRGQVDSWFRIVCARGEATIRLQWRDQKRFAGCALTIDVPPFAIDIAVLAADSAAGQTNSGRILRLTIEGRGDRRILVFEDQTAGKEGLIDCPLVPKGLR